MQFSAIFQKFQWITLIVADFCAKHDSCSEQKLIFNSLHHSGLLSNVLIVNYKLLFNSLPTNKKFNNRYDKKCYLCNKITDEDISHIFVECDQTKKCFAYIKNNFLTNKNTSLTLSLVQSKLELNKKDYRLISNFVYSIWRARNKIKHSVGVINMLSLFERIFNKWSISITGI